jgi:manganese/zinc/iron transport system permease protein
MREFLLLDVPMLFAALMALVACGTLGNWLVLRKESMTGDAIAHAVLPGLVAGFLIAGRHSLVAMFAGAAGAGVAAILLAGWIRRTAGLEAGAALGIVFTSFFALGVALLETQGARQIDLDPNCVLFGALETLFYVPAESGAWLDGVPRPLWTLAAAALASVLLSMLAAKELTALAFDGEHARASGIAPRWLEPALLFTVSMVVVASFEAVGSLLVVALLACPSLIAAPHTSRVRSRFALSLGAGAAITVAGHFLAAYAPRALGADAALNAAGMIALLLAAAVPVSFGLRAALNRRRA